MKKSNILIVLAMLFASFVFTGCNSCQKEKDGGFIVDDADTAISDTSACDTAALIVENCISADRQWMYINYTEKHGSDYRWFETAITLKEQLNSAECDGTIESVTNIFQYVIEHEKSCDVEVIGSVYQNGSHEYSVVPGFWVGDNDLSQEEVKLTFKEAFDKLMATNCVKPASRQCVLRKPLGPNANEKNPVYIFGNRVEYVAIDAVTGEAVDCFMNLNKPLGEWP